MSSVVADTHSLLWHLIDPQKLSVDAQAALDKAELAGTPIYISSISLIEIRYLIEKGKLTGKVMTVILAALNDTNVALTDVPLDVNIAEKN